ncbi:MAG: hypothetical protein EBT41_04745 [Betaproteobacteria bacterium]|nr:hypothetical protein [Betaproteobacteria bacterium]
MRSYLALTKPRVVLLAAFCALIGMLLATDRWVGWPLVLGAIGGISLLAAAGFVLNCLIEREIDARMARTRWRPSVRGEVNNQQAVGFALALGLAGALLLWHLAWRLYLEYSDALAKRLFRYSIWYLAYLFAALLIDHYLRLLWLPGAL